jgi:GNAT superfamily N-acetyltransferase
VAQRKWVARPYRERDDKGIFELTRDVYPHRDYNFDEWLRRRHWLNGLNPAGDSIMWIAENDEGIVGYDSAVCMEMKLGESQVTGIIGVDTMTHPQYRRQGIYITLRRKRDAEFENRGIKLAYGFGGKGEAHPIGKRHFGSQDIHTTSVLIRSLKWHNLMESRTQNRILTRLGVFGGSVLQGTIYRIKKMAVPSGLMIRKAPKFDERIDDFWSEISRRYQIMLVRNRAFLNWRYVDIPDIEYSILLAEKDGKIVGYLVFRTLWWERVNVSVIFDILAESHNIAQCLVMGAVRHAQEDDADLVYCSMMADRQVIGSLRNNGFMPLRFASHTFTSDFIAADIPREFVLNPKNWYAQIGDSDFF